MGGADDHAILVRQLGVQRVVGGERIVPHGGPEIVTLEPQDEFKDVRVHPVVQLAVLLPRPGHEARAFVVDEDAAIFYRRRTLHVTARVHVERAVAFGRHVGPPIPGRHPDLFGQVIHAENRPALVAAGDDEGAFDSGQRPAQDLNRRRLPLACNVGDINLPVAHKLINHCAAANSAD